MAALVPTPIDNEGLFVQLIVELARELFRAPIVRVSEVDVTHLPIGRPLDVRAIQLGMLRYSPAFCSSVPGVGPDYS